MTTAYIVPENPCDPEAAALELIVRLPEARDARTLRYPVDPAAVVTSRICLAPLG